MRILYVAKHGSGGNDDEGAIAHALMELGHTVMTVPEDSKHFPSADLCLFHKWDDFAAMDTIDCPKAMWYFDLVVEPTMPARTNSRIRYMREVLPRVDFPFATDGDFCSEANLYWLPQGADGRIVGRGIRRKLATIPILFTGGTSSSLGRAEWVTRMAIRYGSMFYRVGRGCYRERLKSLIASADIVMAPPSPSSDKYWSNRVYISLGFAAFMLHPECRWLKQHYESSELPTYCCEDEMHAFIAMYMYNSAKRREISRAALDRTVKHHLYKHRCEAMMEVIASGNSKGLG